MTLKRALRAIVISLTAPAGGVAWAACTSAPEMPDGGHDASSGDAPVDQSTNPFPEGAVLDSYVDWCDAGPPEFFFYYPQCYNYFYVPCGIPSSDTITETDAGMTLNRCDQICKGVGALSCTVVGNPLVDSGLVLDATPDVNGPDSAVFVQCDGCTGGRRPEGLRAPQIVGDAPLGSYFSRLSHLEAASIPAFERMRAELNVLGASTELLSRIESARRDEQRHARETARLARRFGGALPEVHATRFESRSLVAIACENIAEGCVRETYGALVATWQAEHARDPDIRAVMTRIADDETRHAALSWDVAEFLGAKLDAESRARVAAARRQAIIRLYEEVARDPHADVIAAAGVPCARDARRLLDALAATVWAPRAQPS